MPLTDTQGRAIGYLRLSLTRACQMRCTYCRPRRMLERNRAGGLSVDEIATLVRHMTDYHGLHKVRLTGGDPTARPDLIHIIERIAGVPGIDDLAMTTNGLTLAARAADYANAGLSRVNVSLDSLDRDNFERMTGIDGLGRVLAGIKAAMKAGLTPLRLNTVVMRHNNDHGLLELVEYAASIGAEIRFIELMPMGPLADRWAEHYVPAHETRRRFHEALNDWESLRQHHDSARRYRVTTANGLRTTIGFITPMSCDFCADCNRIRIDSGGTVYPCLMDKPVETILPALRPIYKPGLLNTILAGALAQKQPKHPVKGFVTMTHIGG